MSHFISPMPAAGLIEMPPVSKVTPLPMKPSGGLPAFPPRCSMTTTRGGRTLPWPTPSNAPMPSFGHAGFVEDLDREAEPGQLGGLFGERLRIDRVGRLGHEIAGEEHRLGGGAQRAVGLFCGGRRLGCDGNAS